MQEKIMKIVEKALIGVGTLVVTELVKNIFEEEEKSSEEEIEEMKRNRDELTEDLERLIAEMAALTPGRFIGA